MKQNSNKTFNYMKSKGRFYILVTQPILFSGITTIIIIVFNFFYLLLDHGLNLATKYFLQGIVSGWSVILFVFAGMCLILASVNGIMWLYYSKKY